MDISRLYEFLDLAMTLSFTKSAANLNMSQPTLSRHIADLEKELRTELFVRVGNSIKLTESGRALFEKSNSITASLDGLLPQFSKTKRVKKDVVKVAGSTLQPAVNRIITKMAMRATTRDLPFELAYHKTRSLHNEPPSPFPLGMLQEQEIDVAVDCFAPDKAPDPALDPIKICYEPLVLYARADNPLAGRHDLRSEDLSDVKPVALALLPNCPPVMFAPFVASGIDPSRQRVIYVDNMLEVPRFLAQLDRDEVAVFQDGISQAYGYDFDETGSIVTLDMRDDRSRVEFWGVIGASPMAKAWHDDIRALFEQIIEDGRRNATPDQLHEDGTLWSSALYPRLRYHEGATANRS